MLVLHNCSWLMVAVRNGASSGLAPGPCSVRDRHSAARARDAKAPKKLAADSRPQLRSGGRWAGGETCTALELPLHFTKLPLSLLSQGGEIVEHQGIAPCIPVGRSWRTAKACISQQPILGIS